MCHGSLQADFEIHINIFCQRQEPEVNLSHKQSPDLLHVMADFCHRALVLGIIGKQPCNSFLVLLESGALQQIRHVQIYFRETSR